MNIATERASVVAASTVPVPALAAAVEKAGYAIAEESVELLIGGMTCASCVGRVEKALKGVPGVKHAEVNLATERAQVRFDAGLPPERLVAAVVKAGYEAQVADTNTPTEHDKQSAPWWPVALAAGLSFPWYCPCLACCSVKTGHSTAGFNWPWPRLCSSGWARGSTALAGRLFVQAQATWICWSHWVRRPGSV